METWVGAACICIQDSKLLMVLQGKKDEDKKWTIPSGGLESYETIEQCCIREVFEETGYAVELTEKLHVKRGITFGVPVEVHYYKGRVLSGVPVIQDPDELIYEIRWVDAAELCKLSLSFPEDKELLLQLLGEARDHAV
ncbi:NUDIX hydrolase [Fictibacillus aquaticus]|uniref:DNA mismatch repair protein MutT n=1 Tax=Fictibacillus aquaticus TaxID=2021314 RepID=A0A235F4Q8_9BACL|nr:NUDIX hydrolase [Fictibacillus aquaticus]OYD56286.1 DNA mismatch repair protein MutT [Fictibacillus aquaticus]